jgi:hypothetical protein
MTMAGARPARRLGALLLAALLVLPACSGPVAPPTAPIRFQPLPLDRSDPARRQVGALTFLGAWKLTGDSPLFGGVSAMAVDGERFTMLSDSGQLIRFSWRGGAQAIGPTIVALPAPPPTADKRYDRDSESLSIDPASGRVLVGFEVVNQIRRYSPDFAAWEATVSPPLMKLWQSNGGAESIAVLRDGRVLVLAEVTGRPSPFRRGLLFDRDPTLPGVKATRFRYRPPPHFQPTDAAQLPDGRILVLNRRFSLLGGFEAALTIVDPAQIRPFANVGSGEIAHLARPLTVDNLEALAIAQEEGRTILWIASDDNHSRLQRTLLIKFALDTR